MRPHPPCVLCPIDFSEFSRAAFAHAVAIADHFGAHLIAMSVDDPLLTEAAAAAGFTPRPSETVRELQRFCGATLASFNGPRTLEYRVAVGKPATEILREAEESQVDLIVISSHGHSGMRKLFFGSTTERVLRETRVPVLVTRDSRPSFTSFSELARHITRIVAPIDLTDTSAHQLAVAQGIARGLSVPLMVVHVQEPLFIPYSVRLALPGAEATRRAQADEKLAGLIASLDGAHRPESIVLTGDPSEEIVKLAEARQAGLIVMGLHSSGALGSRIGSITYRVLCQAHALVLAVPAKPISHATHTVAATALVAAR